MPEPAIPSRALPPVQHEASDVSLRSMLALFALIGSTLLVMAGLAWLLFPNEGADRRFAQPFPQFPAPPLQPSPPLDMQVFYQQELAQLNGAGWQNAAHTQAHIPIGQAMRAVAAEGIAGWPASPAASRGDRR